MFVKSSYAENLRKITDDVESGLLEANSNTKYLEPLQLFLSKMHDENRLLNELHQTTLPIFQIFRRIWQYSTHYNHAARMVVLLKSLCNDFIGLLGDKIDHVELKMNMKLCVEWNIVPISAPAFDFQTTITGTLALIMDCISEIDHFKKQYARSAELVEEENLSFNPWNFDTNTIFESFGLFSERLNDVRDFFCICKAFAGLKDINIKGDGGKSSSQIMHTIYHEFKEAFSGVAERLQAMDILDHEDGEVREIFAQTKQRVKDWDAKLSVVLRNCLSVPGELSPNMHKTDNTEHQGGGGSTAGIEGQIALLHFSTVLHSFRFLLEREDIRKVVLDRYPSVITACRSEIVSMHLRLRMHLAREPLGESNFPTSRKQSDMFIAPRVDSENEILVTGSVPFDGMPHFGARLTLLASLRKRVENAWQPFWVCTQDYGLGENKHDIEELQDLHEKFLADVQTAQDDAYAHWVRNIDSIKLDKLDCSLFATMDILASPSLVSLSSGTLSEESRAKMKDDTSALRAKFNEYDEDGSGQIDAIEFKSFMKAIVPNISDTEITETMAVLDESGDNQVDFEEFQKWWIEDLSSLKILFRSLDSDGSGSMDASEFGFFLQKLGISFSLPQFQIAMRQIDQNHLSEATTEEADGQIDFGEFVVWWKDFISNNNRELLVSNMAIDLRDFAREIRYMAISGWKLTDQALRIYTIENTMKLQLSQVEMIVSQYNGVLVTMISVEKPLVKVLLDDVKAEIQIGLKEIQWTMERAPTFLTNLLALTSQLSSTIEILKQNVVKIQDLLQEWQRNPLIASSWLGKTPLNLQEEATQLDEKHDKIRGEADVIRECVNASWMAVRPYLAKNQSKEYTEDGSTEWNAYYKHVQDIVAQMVRKVIGSSLKHIDKHFDHSHHENTATSSAPSMLYRQQSVERSLFLPLPPSLSPGNRGDVFNFL
jgi:Ca2+-binding EF-hand superfamily protein